MKLMTSGSFGVAATTTTGGGATCDSDSSRMIMTPGWHHRASRNNKNGLWLLYIVAIVSVGFLLSTSKDLHTNNQQYYNSIQYYNIHNHYYRHEQKQLQLQQQEEEEYEESKSKQKEETSVLFSNHKNTNNKTASSSSSSSSSTSIMTNGTTATAGGAGSGGGAAAVTTTATTPAAAATATATAATTTASATRNESSISTTTTTTTTAMAAAAAAAAEAAAATTSSSTTVSISNTTDTTIEGGSTSPPQEGTTKAATTTATSDVPATNTAADNNNIDNDSNNKLIGIFEPCDANREVTTYDMNPTNILLQTPLGWDQSKKKDIYYNNTLPLWINELCPSVVKHFELFPSFATYPSITLTKKVGNDTVPYDEELPISTTNDLAIAVCTLSVLKQMVTSIDGAPPLYMFAGSNLGALLHGQPMPWDDDVDVIFPYYAKDQFLKLCNRDSSDDDSSSRGKRKTGYLIHNQTNAFLRCAAGHNAFKVYVDWDTNDSPMIGRKRDYKSPYIDCFLYTTNVMSSTDINNVKDKGLRKKLQLAATAATANGGNEFDDTTSVTVIGESNPAGGVISQSKIFTLEQFFPTQPYYFGGIHVMGTNPQLISSRYNLRRCFLPNYRHRTESPFYMQLLELDCCKLATMFPFLYRYDNRDAAVDDVANQVHGEGVEHHTHKAVLANNYRETNDGGGSSSSSVRDSPTTTTTPGSSQLPIYTWSHAASTYNNPPLVTSAKQRKEWSNITDESLGQNLSNSLIPKGLNQVEIDNTISSWWSPSASSPTSSMSLTSLRECLVANKNASIVAAAAASNLLPITVMEYNAERGKNWLEAIDVLQQADIIILNEMDIGMARSGQQHTTRQLATMLQMNYAYGIEFVELTNGDQHEQARTTNEHNFYGLHGNAILTRCGLTMEDPIIYRNSIGKYYSNDKMGLNAHGYEKRLGGRMGMFVRVTIPETDKSLVVGSTRKLQAGENGIRSEIIQYIAAGGKASDNKAATTTIATVTAGDQNRNFCQQIGLVSVDNPRHNTWPASCNGFGRTRGDNICASTKINANGGGGGASSNVQILEPERTILPCYQNHGISATLSDHAYTLITLGIEI